MARPQGFIFCMTDVEAAFFRSLLCRRDQWSQVVFDRDGLARAMAERPPRTRLVSFCSDLIIPSQIVDQLGGQCFNFHSGPPERPGFRPTAFALSQGVQQYGVTFHRLTARIDAGTIYSTRRFSLPPNATLDGVEVLVYEHLIALAKDLARPLADFDASFQSNGEVWTGQRTTRADFERLHQPHKGIHHIAQ